MEKDDEPPSGIGDLFFSSNSSSDLLLKGGPVKMDGEDEE